MMEKSERFWNKLSKNYDKKAKDKTFEEILSRTPKYLNSGDIVLDFACATGLYSFAFAKGVKKIEAFDTSSEMVALAKRTALSNEIENISFSQTTLFDQKYQENGFDTILAFNILLYFEDIEQVLRRMRQLLKPGGLIITSTACLKEKRTLIGLLSGSIIYVLTKLGILPYLNFLKIEELKETILKSGFTRVETDVLIEKPALEYYIVARKN